MKRLLSLMALFVISLLTVSMVSAVADNSTLGDLTDLDVKVEVNDEENDNTSLTVERGEELEVEVKFEHSGMIPAKNIEVEAQLLGYDEEDPSDSELVESVPAQSKGTGATLKLTVPDDFAYGPATLRVTVSGGANEADLTVDYPLFVETPSHSVKIADVSFSPSLTVKAGKSLLTTVLLENVGDNAEDDVKVTVEVPELDLKASEYVDSVAADDHEDVDEMFLQIPADAPAGEYTVKVTAEYDDLDESVTKEYTLKVLENDLVKPQTKTGKLVLAVGPEMQTVAAGKTASYAVALTNDGTASKAYMLEVATGDWASATLSESLVVLEPGKSKVVYMDLAVKGDATLGEHLTSVTVKSGSDVLETVVLKANVVQSAASASGNEAGLRNGLEIALIVLVVLLVIMAMVIGFSRLRKDDDGEEKYY